MKMVGINCNILLDDETASWVEGLIQEGSLPSEIAFYLTQKRIGGYIVKAEELDSIVEDVISDSEDNIEATGNLSREVIEEAMRSALTEFLTQGTMTIGQPVQNTRPAKPVVEEIPIESNVVSFTSEDGDAEPMSEEDIDDLADFFGF